MRQLYYRHERGLDDVCGAADRRIARALTIAVATEEAHSRRRLTHATFRCRRRVTAAHANRMVDGPPPPWCRWRLRGSLLWDLLGEKKACWGL